MPVAARTCHGMLASARGARVEHGPQHTCATRGERVEDVLVLDGHRLAESLVIRTAMASHHVGDGGHGLRHQPLDPGDRLLLPLGREVQIDHRAA